MRTARQVADRVAALRVRNAKRDLDYKRLIAIRKGDYEAVVPGLFNTAEFDKPLVANLIDTTARDIAEVMAPMPGVNCTPASQSNDAEKRRQDIRSAIANSYIQGSRLQQQMFEGADRYGSFGFLAYIVEPDFTEQTPLIRIGTNPFAEYQLDQLGRCKMYAEVHCGTVREVIALYPQAAQYLTNHQHDQVVEVATYLDEECSSVVLLEPCVTLAYARNEIGRCPVTIVKRPNIVPGDVRGQFDDVIWVQVARALTQMYTFTALDQAVNAPIAVPKDVQELELGPMTVIQSDNPGQIGRVPLNLPQGLLPQQQILAQEQRTGSRYPEGRSGSIDASIITGQGVQALMGTFDTQVQTFQRLNTSALEDVMEFCFRMDEAYWGGTKKKRHIKDNGSSREFEYVPSKDINGNYTVDVSYGAIAGLDPNRGLVFILQALAGKLISVQTARKSLPVDMNPEAEERQIELEELEASVMASLSQLPLAIPQMAMAGADPRELALQVAEVKNLVQKGKTPTEAMVEVFAPKEKPGQQPAAPPAPDPLAALMGGGGPQSPGSDLLMGLAGLTPGGNANLQANVSSYREV